MKRMAITELTGNHRIGSTAMAEGEADFRATNPSTGESLEPKYLEAMPHEADRAMEAAARAAGAYRALSSGERASFLRAIAEEIEDLGDALIDRAHAETALGHGRLQGERARTTNQLRMFADLVDEGSWVDARIDRAIPRRKPAPKPDIRRMLIPIGPVVVFGASNFPLAFSVAGGDTASALAAGCPVVVKAHPAHPGTSELVANAIVEAARISGMPEGVFSMIHGREPATAVRLVRNPHARAVGFTGSHRAGRALFDAAASRPAPIPVYAEMGSTNPVFVLPRAARSRGDAIAEELHGSVSLGVGQFCTKPGVIVGQGDAIGRIAARMGALAEETPTGAMLYEGISEAFRAGVQASQAVEGVRVAGCAAQGDAHAFGDAVTILATDALTFLQHDELSEEVFGPATLIVESGARDEMMDVARNLEGHLTATVLGTEADLEEFEDLIRILEQKVGRLLFNGVPTGVEVCPSMQHGGPYPATTDVRSTSVGTAAIFRFVRPLAYQNFPQSQLPVELRDDNRLGIWRTVDGVLTKD